MAMNDADVSRIEALEKRLAELEEKIVERSAIKEMISGSILQPDLSRPSLPADAPFMEFSTCHSADFRHPRFFQMIKLLGGIPHWHRKHWEWAFILHHLLATGALREGARGLGFGVGAEPIPAALANLGAHVVGTDAPVDLQNSAGWSDSNQHAAGLDSLRMPWCADAVFDKYVSFQPCDMLNIDPALKDFDFTWSSCCFEHLGSLEAGLDFVQQSVEACLKPGGVAVHTTEYNLSSGERTIEASEWTVIYRHSDLVRFADHMRSRGHEVHPILRGPDAHGLDFHVDVPPYSMKPQLRLQIAEHQCTSVGLVIRRGERY